MSVVLITKLLDRCTRVVTALVIMNNLDVVRHATLPPFWLGIGHLNYASSISPLLISRISVWALVRTIEFSDGFHLAPSCLLFFILLMEGDFFRLFIYFIQFTLYKWFISKVSIESSFDKTYSMCSLTLSIFFFPLSPSVRLHSSLIPFDTCNWNYLFKFPKFSNF